MRSLSPGRGHAPVQCAAIPPTLVDTAAAGIPSSPGCRHPVGSRDVPGRTRRWAPSAYPSRVSVGVSAAAGRRPSEARWAAARAAGSAMFLTCAPGGSLMSGPASNSTIVACGACSLRTRA